MNGTPRKKRIAPFWLAGFALLGMHSAHAAWGDSQISAMAGPWPITIRTCWHDAGAICSLTWRGKEFINDYDRGRQLQSAANFGEIVEAFNPTEAGSERAYNGINDPANPTPSNSLLQGLWTSGNVLATQTKMAFWLPVGGSLQSNHILNKQVTIGAYGLPHVIEYATQFTIPGNEHHTLATFEAVTGYMPPEFSQFYTFDVKGGATNLVPLSDGPGEQTLPVIFSTPDGGWAMGIYSPNASQTGEFAGTGYGRFRYGDTVKWNYVYRVRNPSPGPYYFYSYVIVGSLDNVKISMQQLHSIIN